MQKAIATPDVAKYRMSLRHSKELSELQMPRQRRLRDNLHPVSKQGQFSSGNDKIVAFHEI